MNSAAKNVLIWFGALAALAGVFAFMWWIFQQTGGLAARMTPVRASDWKYGNAQAMVSVLEYSDFQCPACKEYQPLIDQMHKDFASTTLFVYRYFPLPQHAHAYDAAYAAEAAGRQGKFWEMGDLLFQNQDAWANASDAKPLFSQYAGRLGLDVKKFEADEVSQDVHDRVAQDQQTGVADGIRATPTFFLNGAQITFGSYDELTQILNRALAR